MKPNIDLLLLGLLLTTTLKAQNPENNKILRGKVLFQNSKCTPATGVAVSGMIKIEKEENTNKVYSDSRGNYELQFPLARKGHPVKLTIGNTDKTGQELEVVNEKEISLCRIPANASQEFEVIVCPKGARDVAARKYYKILKNSAEKAYEQMQQEFRALTEAQNKDYKTIQQVADDLTKLQEQIYDSIAIYKEAMAIASINKDGVNERVINYLKLLDEGKSIQEARKELSISKASNDMEQGITLFRAGVKELEERARASAAVFDYKDAVVCYDTLISKAEKLNIDQLELSGYYQWAVKHNKDAGYYQKALENNNKELAILEKLLYSLDLKLATSYSNLATIFEDLGSYDEALNFSQKALKIREAVLASDNPELATSYNNLSVNYLSLGRYQEALTVQQKAVNIREAILKSDHPDLASSYNNLAVINLALGSYKEALIAEEKALTIQEVILGINHPDLATSYNNLALIYKALSRYDKALSFQQKAVNIRETLLESDHPFLATAYNNLATIYQDLGSYDKALKFSQKALRIQEAVLEPTHPSLATSYNNLALIYLDLGDYEEALTTQLIALKIQEGTLELDHPSLATSYNSLASIYCSLGLHQQALTTQQKALRIQEAILEPNHPSLGGSYNNLAAIYQDLGHYQKALIAQQKALKIFEAIVEPEHTFLATSYFNLATIYQALGQYKEALQNLDTVTKYQKNAKAFYLKGFYYYKLKQYQKATKTYQKVIEIDSTLKPKPYYNNIGLAYAKNHQFPEAKAAFTEYQKLYPKNGQPYRNWAMYYALQNQKEKALENLEKAIALGYKDLKWLETDDSMEGLRNEPRFKVLLEKLRE
jgi:tetratricopeptide (TPR) repeat protein